MREIYCRVASAGCDESAHLWPDLSDLVGSIVRDGAEAASENFHDVGSHLILALREDVRRGQDEIQPPRHVPTFCNHSVTGGFAASLSGYRATTVSGLFLGTAAAAPREHDSNFGAAVPTPPQTFGANRVTEALGGSATALPSSFSPNMDDARVVGAKSPPAARIALEALGLRLSGWRCNKRRTQHRYQSSHRPC